MSDTGKELKQVLAHYVACQLFHRLTGALPKPEQLVELVTGKAPGLSREDCVRFKAALAGFADCKGELQYAAQVVADCKPNPPDPSRIYQQRRLRRHKKGLGQVFTPARAVEAAMAMAAAAPDRVADPACGSGDFLLRAAELWPGAELWGSDIDSTALAIARSRLSLSGANFELDRGNFLLLPRTMPRLAASFDLVAGNPPWGSVLRQRDIAGYEIGGERPLNSFVYFIQLAHWLLQPGGCMVLVLPEAFAKVRTYQAARRWLLERFVVTGLHYIPNLFHGYYVPALLLAAIKQTGGQRSVPVKYQPSLGRPAVQFNLLPPAALNSRRFQLNWCRELEELWAYCSRGAVHLREGNLGGREVAGEAVVDFSLGIVTGNNRRFVADKPLTPAHLPLLYAKDVRPFRIGPPSRWLVYDREKLQQAAPLAKFRQKKLVYRFVAREIVTAVDYSGALTINNLNIIVPLRLPFDLEYLAALLNSRLLNTLYIYRFFTGKVLTGHLKQLPLQVGTAQQQRQVVQLARQLAEGKGELAELDKLVDDVYQLQDCQRQLVASQYRQLKEVFFV